MDHEFFHRSDDPPAFETEAAAYCERRALDFRYLRAFRDYQVAYSGTVVKDASFLVRLGGETVGLVFAPIEKRDANLSISSAGGYIPAPATDNDAVEKAAFARLDEIAKAAGVEKIVLNACLSNHHWQWNRLRVYGYTDTSALDAIVNLTLEETDLWLLLRRSYRSLINKYSDRNGCETIIVNADRPNHDLHETYRQLHAEAAGRVTRDKATFDLQYRMLLDGHATLMAIKCEDRKSTRLNSSHPSKSRMPSSA